MSDGFTVQDGWMNEAAVHDLAQWYHENCPDTSTLTFEAHLMIIKSYLNLIPGSPLDPAFGLSRARYNILRLLYRAPSHRLLMGDFAEDMNVSPTNITKLMDSLVTDGFVVRVPHEVDKRKTWAQLTEEGAKTVERSIPDVGEHVTGLWMGLDEEEKRVLVHLLAKMRMHSVSADTQTPASILKLLATSAAE
jgi:DNA-binding MarR family transcriptional regulator